MNTALDVSEYEKRQKSILRTQRFSKAFPRLLLAGIVITMLPLILLGFHISLICQGLFLATLQLSTIWNPAKKVIDRLSGLREGESLITTPLNGTWVKILLIFLSLPWLALAGAGAWLLVKTGFLELNPIYMLLSH
jgi:hypothetical protein